MTAFERLKEALSRGAADNETHVISLNIREVGELVDRVEEAEFVHPGDQAMYARREMKRLGYDDQMINKTLGQGK